MKTKATKFDGLLDTNKEFIKALAKNRENAKKKLTKAQKREILKKVANDEIITDANGNEVSSLQAYAEQIVQRTQLGIEAQLVAADFFNRDSVELGEQVLYTIREKADKVKVNVINEHGDGAVQKYASSRKVFNPQPYLISTPKVAVNKQSLLRGDLTAEQVALEDIADALANKIDIDAWDLLKAGLFNDISTVEGVDIDDRVTEFPDSNDLDMSAEGAFTLPVAKAIAKYFLLTGRKVRNVYVPSTRVTDLWDWMSKPAGYADDSGVTADVVVPEALQEKIIRTGTLNNLFGYDTNLVPLNTLNGDPDNGGVYIYVSSDRPAGEYRDVLGMNTVWKKDEPTELLFAQNKAITLFQTPNQRVNYMRIKIA